MTRIYRILLVLLAMTLSFQCAKAQDIMVNVSAKSRILPPQLLLYVSDPSDFFTVQLVNTTSEEQRVYLSLNLTHTMPDDGLLVATPDQYQPTRPFVVPGNGVYSLTLNDMKNLFNHIPSSAMKIPDGLIEGYANGSFGLLPEGEYLVKFGAFRWTGNNHDSPYLLSSPTSGQCGFTVCYNAQAPTWTQPLIMFGNESEPIEIDPKIPIFTLSAPILSCNPSQQYSYTVRIAEKLDFQSPDIAITEGNVVYSINEMNALLIPTFSIPVDVIKNFSPSKTYVAQVTAKPLNSSKMNYIQIANNGKSSLCVFKVKGSESEFSGRFDMGDSELGEKDKIQFSFLNPDIKAPYFEEGTARKVYQELDIDVRWEPAWFQGGRGNPDTLDISYNVELYNGSDEAEVKNIIDKKNLIFSQKVAEDKTSCTIEWDSIATKAKANDHLVLRVMPVCKNDVDSIVFNDDSVNVRDFTLRDFIGPDYFRCSNLIELDNKTPTKKKGEDFKGKTVTIGQYEMLIDSITGGSAKDGFTGKGKVAWNLEKIGTINVHVKFEKLKINTDDVVYEGTAKGMEDPKAGKSLEAVNSLFSDIGLNDLLADAGVPYAEKITSGTKKAIADKVPEIADYYTLVTASKNIWDLLSSGKVDIYLPICMPKGVTSLVGELPVDIQVTKMEFAPTYATMDLLGEYVMPESENIASDILAFGAPRLCISPDHILPESGQIALLDDFKVVEPSSGYSCTFKAPSDLLEPVDGTFVSWKNYEFEVMGIDVDMEIPKLKKYDLTKKELTDALPKLTIRTKIASWDEFMVDEVTMEPFEVASLPGFTFVVDKMAYDHSRVENTSSMSSFSWPKRFKMEEVVGKENLGKYGKNSWEGFFIKTLSIMLPEGLTSTADDSKDRLAITAKNFLIDKSGVTVEASFENLFEAYAGSFGISVKKIGLDVIQNNFDNCYINGDLGVPLLKDEKDEHARLDFECQIRRQLDDEKKETDNFAYVFNTRQLSGDFKLDLYAAKLILDSKQTYFLLEAEPKDAKAKKSDTNKLVTRCELMLGGRMELGKKDDVNDILSERLGTDISIPDIHFVGMRIANCKTWKSKYVNFQANVDSLREIQEKKAIASLYTKGKEITNGSEERPDTTFYFHTGSWSLASAKKKLGPFEFSLVNYDFSTKSEGKSLVVGLSLDGRINVVSGIELGAEAGVTIHGSIRGLDFKDLSNLECSLDSASLDSIKLDASFSSITFKGALYMSKDSKSEKGKGFEATLDIALPGDFMSLHASGAYYNKEGETEDDTYTWGYLNLKMGAKIELGPAVITKLGGGFYFNCSPTAKNKDGNFTLADVRNVKGLIGLSLSMDMASPDETAVKGSLEMAVVYNRDLKCLTQFVMTGNVKAVGGLINSNMSLVYENTPMEKYLQLNITVDAKVSTDVGDYLGDWAKELGSIKEQLDKIAGSKFDIISGCKAGLDSKIGAKAEDPKPDEEPKQEPESNDAKSAAKTDEQKKMASLCSTTVTLDVKITWKSGGVEYAKPRWHFYLGEPAEDKRCTVTYIDVGKEGDIVHCKFGANFYLCFGNELPDDGILPPIPTKISDFLDGASHGDGYVSDNMSQVTEARNEALSSFKSDFGALLGAQGYGNIGINLGLIYGKIEAIAGFDASLTHYKNALCTNFGKSPGYNGWYARGQLYAYMGMELGAKFDLGFVSYDIPLVKAGVGGVLKMGGPHPSYFQGKVRAKLSLLGGLFQIDKSYTFDVGEQCVLFQGNALDNFTLFSYCTLGDTIKENGWASDKENIDGGVKLLNKNVRTPQYIDTEAPLEEHFRVIDNNELERITNNTGIIPGSKEHKKLYMQACRTFMFSTEQQYAVLYEYDDPKSDTWPDQDKSGRRGRHYGEVQKTSIPFDANSTGTRHFLDLSSLRSALNEGKYYRLVVTGKALELHDGEYKDPYTCDTVTNDCDYRSWSRTVCYYFRTAESEVVDDKLPLSDYVAVAYPSSRNTLTNESISSDSESGMSDYMAAYLSDVQSPTIALTQDIRDLAFKEGSLYWRLLNPMGQQIDIAKNAFVEYGSGRNVVGLNMEPEHPLNARPNQKYILELDYFTKGTKVVNDQGRTVSALVDTCLLRLFVETTATDRNWKTKSGLAKEVEYDKPFTACRIVDYELEEMSPLLDVTLLTNGKYVYDPFWYLGYMSNFAFPAGWSVTESGFFGLEVTTSESVIFQHGGRKYEGVYDDQEKSPHKAYSEYNTIRDMVFNKVGEPGENWNLPSDRWMTNGSADYVFAGPTTYEFSRLGGFNTKDTRNNLGDILYSIRRAYSDVGQFDSELRDAADWVAAQWHGLGSKSDTKAAIRYLVDLHRGQYITPEGSTLMGEDYKSYKSEGKDVGKTASYSTNSASVSVPYYMIPTIFSIAYLEKASGAFSGFNNDSPRAKNAKGVYERMNSYGKDKGTLAVVSFDASEALKHLKTLTAVCYRINTYDFVNGHYGVTDRLQNGMAVFQTTVSDPFGDSSSSTYSRGGYNDSGTSTGETKTSDPSGLDTSKDSATFDANRMKALAKQITDCSGALTSRMEKVGKVCWKDYGQKLKDLKSSSEEALYQAKRAFRFVCEKKGQVFVDRTVELSNAAIEKANGYYDAVSQSNADIWPGMSFNYGKYENGKYEYTNHLDGYHGLLGGAWDELKDMGDPKSKEYKRYEKLYNDGNEAYLNICMWNDSIGNSTSWRVNGEAYQAKKTIELAESYINNLDVADDLDASSKEAQDAYLKAQELYSQEHDFHLKKMSRLKTITDAIEGREDQIKKGKLTENKSAINLILKQLNGYETELKGFGSCFTEYNEYYRKLNNLWITQNDSYGYFISSWSMPEDLTQMKVMKQACELISERVQFVVDDSLELRKQLDDLSFDIFKRIANCRDAFEKRLDEIESRDVTKANAMVAKIDSVIALRTSIWNDYLDSSDGNDGIAAMYDLYESIIRDRISYHNGRLEAMNSCAGRCNQYASRITELTTAYETVVDRVRAIGVNEYLTGILEAGYDETSTLYVNAKNKDTEGLAAIVTRPIYDELAILESIRSGKGGAWQVINDQTVFAYSDTKFREKEDLIRWLIPIVDIVEETNDRERFYSSAGVKALEEMTAMYYAGKAESTTDVNSLKKEAFTDFSDPTSRLNAMKDEAVSYMDKYRKGAVVDWMENGTYYGPRYYLEHALEAVNSYSGLYDDFKDRMSAILTLSEMIADTLDKAETIRNRVPDVANPQAGTLNTRYKSVKAYYTGSPFSRLESLRGIAAEASSTMNDVIVPMRTEASEALAYINRYGQPRISPEDSILRAAYLEDYHALGKYREGIEQYFVEKDGKKVYHGLASYVPRVKANYKSLTETWMPVLRDNNSKIAAMPEPTPATDVLERNITLYGYSKAFMDEFMPMRDSTRRVQNIFPVIVNELGKAREAYSNLEGHIDDAKLREYAAMIKQIEDAGTDVSKYVSDINNMYDEAVAMPYMEINQAMKNSQRAVKNYVEDYYNSNVSEVNTLFYSSQSTFNTIQTKWATAEDAYEECATIIASGSHPKNSEIQAGIDAYDYIVQNYPSFGDAGRRMNTIISGIAGIKRSALAVGFTEADFADWGEAYITGKRDKIIDFRNDVSTKRNAAVRKSAEMEDWK